MRLPLIESFNDNFNEKSFKRNQEKFKKFILKYNLKYEKLNAYVATPNIQ